MDDESHWRSRFSALVRCMDEDRTRLAERLHDTVAQNLAALSMKIGIVEQELSERQRTLLSDCAGFVATSISDLRAEMQQLQPALIGELGLVSCLVSFAKVFQVSHGAELIIVDQLYEPKAARADTEAAVFRIVQDAAAAFALAGAAVVCVKLSKTADLLRVTVACDTGTLSAPVIDDLTRCIMEERAVQNHGRLNIHSSPGKAHVDIEIPLKERL